MKFEITQEKRGEVEAVMGRFKNQLSEKEILRATAGGINDALRTGISNRQKGINSRIKAKYNIKQKYLSKQTKIAPKATGSRLWGGIRVNTDTIPIYAFKPKQDGSHISVAIQKGRAVLIRNSFIATMAGGYTSVFSRGKYVKGQGFVSGKEKTSRGKVRVTKLQTVSPYTMAINKEIASNVSELIGSEVSVRVEGILRKKVEQIKGK